MKLGKQGVSIIEIMVVLVIVTPLFCAGWNALFGSRLAEKTTSMTAAIIGANQLQRFLEIDLASLDTSLGDNAVEVAPTHLVIHTMKPIKIGGKSRGKRETITYSFEAIDPKAKYKTYRVRRNKRRLNSITLARVDLSMKKRGVARWIAADIKTVDPGADDKISYETSILVSLPQSFKASFLFDYTVD